MTRWRLVLLLGLLASPAFGQATPPPEFELSWTAPQSCPDKAAVQAQVAKLAPGSAARDRPLRVAGVVRQSESGFVLELSLRDGELEGRRRFESDSCAEVVGAAAVTIALLLSSATTDAQELAQDPAGASGAGAATGEDVAREKTAASKAAPAASERPVTLGRGRALAPSLAQGTTRSWQLLLAAPAIRVGSGVLPDATVGLAAGFGVEVDAWRFLLSGVWNFEARVPLASGSDYGADVARRSARLSACYWFGSTSWRLAPCATLALEYLVAHGVGSGVATEQADALWLAGGPGVVGGLELADWVRLTASAGLDFQTARPVLVIEGLGEVERLGALELSAVLGAEWIF